VEELPRGDVFDLVGGIFDGRCAGMGHGGGGGRKFDVVDFHSQAMQAVTALHTSLPESPSGPTCDGLGRKRQDNLESMLLSGLQSCRRGESSVIHSDLTHLCDDGLIDLCSNLCLLIESVKPCSSLGQDGQCALGTFDG
jgi:hypothetical protein